MLVATRGETSSENMVTLTRRTSHPLTSILSRWAEHLTHPPSRHWCSGRLQKANSVRPEEPPSLGGVSKGVSPAGQRRLRSGRPYAARQESSKGHFPAGPRPSRRPLRRRGLLRANRMLDSFSVWWGDIMGRVQRGGRGVLLEASPELSSDLSSPSNVATVWPVASATRCVIVAAQKKP